MVRVLGRVKVALSGRFLDESPARMVKSPASAIQAFLGWVVEGEGREVQGDGEGLAGAGSEGDFGEAFEFLGGRGREDWLSWTYTCTT